MLWPATWYAGLKTASWFGGFNLSQYYLSHFALILLILLGSGVVLGGIASIIAIRRYLKA